jgi:hypothetical protein
VILTVELIPRLHLAQRPAGASSTSVRSRGIPFLCIVASIHRRNFCVLSDGLRLSCLYTSSIMVENSSVASSTDMRSFASMMAIKLCYVRVLIEHRRICIPSCAATANEVEMFAGQHDFISFIRIFFPSQSIHDRPHNFQLRETACTTTIYHILLCQSDIWTEGELRTKARNDKTLF